MPVGHPGTRRHPLDLSQPGSQRHRGPELRRRAAWQGREPVNGTARPDQVEPCLWEGQRGSRIGNVAYLGPGPRLLRALKGPRERIELAPDRRIPGQVGGSEVRPEPGDLKIAGGLPGQGRVQHSGPLAGSRAAAGQAGIRLEMQPRGPARAAARAISATTPMLPADTSTPALMASS